MKIFTSSAIKDIDNATCEAQNIPSIELMERAAAAVSCEIISRFTTSQRVVVIAGPGNNGGDALAVARHLIEQGYSKVEVILFNIEGKLSRDCEEQKQRLISIDGVDFTEVRKVFNPPYLGKGDVVVDGLFGSGLNSPLAGGFKVVARTISESGAYIISIDLPSGMFGESNTSTITRNMVHASLTLAFQFPRLSFFFAENAEALGEVKVLDIELDREAMKNLPAQYFLVEERNIRAILTPRNPFAGKRDFGSALLFAGSKGMMGAALMCAEAVMRSGAGLVTVHSAGCGLNPLQTALPVALFEPDKNENYITDMRLHHDHQAVAVGPGIGTSEVTIDALEGLLRNSKGPIVIDADALNCIAARPSLLSLIPPLSILTPHVGEFDRLFGNHNRSEDRLAKGIEMAKRYNVIIVLKGHRTAVIRPTGRVYFNSTGNAGMATAGSGDVLTGIITSFLAQGYRPEHAATIGVFIHGMAGDMASQELSEYGMTATDIIPRIGKALKKIMNNYPHHRR